MGGQSARPKAMKTISFGRLGFLVFGLCAFVAFGDSGRPAHRLNPEKLKDIPKRMQAFVDDRTIAGAVTLVAQGGEIARVDAVGFADIAARKPMDDETLFWIASMTKPITAAAVLMLQDQGKLSVGDLVEKYLPEFKNQWMTESQSGSSNVCLVRAPRPITIRDLLTHTSGLDEMPAPRPSSALAELVVGNSQRPLRFAPGSRWSYSNPGINTLGRIVEVVSGEEFAAFLDQRILGPLGMKDTTFWPIAAQAKRLAKSYQPTTDGTGLQETNIWFIKNSVTDRTRTPRPDGGLFSTARDYFRFCQMMLNGGVGNGKRILSEEAVREMTRTQTGDLKAGFTEGMSFGFGVGVVKQPTGVTSMMSPGTFGHGGAYGTQAWVDPKHELIVILMIQRAKIGNADASDIRKALQEVAAAALSNGTAQ